jgi:decaprenyl-phosphate phosphoribosyltransferase
MKQVNHEKRIKLAGRGNQFSGVADFELNVRQLQTPAHRARRINPGDVELNSHIAQFRVGEGQIATKKAKARSDIEYGTTISNSQPDQTQNGCVENSEPRARVQPRTERRHGGDDVVNDLVMPGQLRSHSDTSQARRFASRVRPASSSTIDRIPCLRKCWRSELDTAPQPVAKLASSALTLADFFQLARPRHWLKNLIVFAAPAAGGTLIEATTLPSVFVAFVLFCVTASGVYCVNDALDARHDRLSSTSSKSKRPVASGRVTVKSAFLAGAILLTIGLAAAVWFRGDFAWLLALYIVLTTAYSVGLKDVAVLDIGAVTSGFLIRAIAGGMVAGVALSEWFLVVATFGSLFLVAGKRYAQRIAADERVTHVRKSLIRYSSNYLRYVWTLSSAVAVTAYCLWSIESPTSTNVFYSLSVVPFALGVLRYALLIEEGRGEAPEDLIFRDAPLQLLGVAWLAVLGFAIYFK